MHTHHTTGDNCHAKGSGGMPFSLNFNRSEHSRPFWAHLQLIVNIHLNINYIIAV